MPGADESEYLLRPCTLEQFNTGVMLHAANVVSHGYKPIHIIANGTDIIELGISFFILVSHCGEYMANGLANAIRHQFLMIAKDRQTFVAVRKHSRSFLWCFECYAGLTSGECMANGLTTAIRHQFAMIAK